MTLRGNENIYVLHAKSAMNEAFQSLHSTGIASSGEKSEMSEIDAKIEAAEARTDTKFAELLGEIRLVNQRLEHVEKATNGLRLNTWMAAASAVGLVAAIVSWGSSMFGVGMSVESVVMKTTQTMQPKIDAIQNGYTETNTKLDQLIRAVSRENSGSSSPAQRQSTGDDNETLPPGQQN